MEKRIKSFLRRLARTERPVLPISRLLQFGFLLVFFAFLYKVYMPRVAAFGCFDDCFNIVAGYFLSQGRRLYSEIFFNHQFLMPYISYAIQALTSPINVYELILNHRKFLLLFSLLFDAILIARFRWVGVGFVLLYEPTKFYLFGDRFLAEGFIVYPLVYMMGLWWFKMNGKILYKIDYVLSALLTWFVIFMREPYIPLAILLYLSILLGKKFTRWQFISLFIFSIVSLSMLSPFSFKDYWFNTVTVSKNTVFALELEQNRILGSGLLKIFFYPFYIFFGGKWSILRHMLMGLSSVFLVLIGIYIAKVKHHKAIVLLILILGIANLRLISPGYVFYEAFHLLPWYGLFIMSIFLLFEFLYHVLAKKISSIFMLTFGILFFYSLFSSQSFIREKIDPHVEFITNYGNFLSNGEVIRILSAKNDTLFVDGFDELIQWQAKLQSSYKYSWYTSVMPLFAKYRDERLNMFGIAPPDFYYGSCPKETLNSRLLPESSRKEYVQLYSFNKPSCIYIYRQKLSRITADQWKKAEQFGVNLHNQK